MKASIAVLVLVAATGVALWPRLDSPVRNAKGADGRPEKSSIMDTGPALERLRDRAELRPCPEAAPGEQGAGPLAGVTVPCLGESGTVNLGAALAGEPALLNVWASWCGPCREEMPALAQYARREGSIQVIGVDVEDHATDALQLMIELGVRYPSIVDVNGEVRRALDAPPVVPLNYLVYPDGSVTRITDPLVFESADEVADAVRRYLDKR